MEIQNSANRELRKQFIRYVPLNVLGMLALSCYILADTFFIANGVGENGLTALNLVLPVYSFISGLGLLFGMGGATKYSIYKSSNHMDSANRVFTLTMLFAIGTGAFVMLIGSLFAEEICTLLGADSTTLPLAAEYLRTIMVFAIAFISNNALICFVRNDGNPNCAMLAMVIGSLSNVVLDYVFIFPLGMGMFGAAIATCLAPIIGIGTLSFHFFSKKSSLRLSKCLSPLKQITEVVSIGFSYFVTEFSTGIVMLMFNFIILSIAGNIGVAAYGIVANLNLFAVAIFAGISEGVQPLISEAYGVQNFASLRKVFGWAIGLSILIGLTLYLAVFAFTGQIAEIFNRDGNPQLTLLAVKGIRQYFPLLFLSGVNIVTASLFAAISRTGASFLISTARAIGFVAILGFLFSGIWGMTGVWITMPCSELFTFAISIILLKRLSLKQLSEDIPLKTAVFEIEGI